MIVHDPGELKPERKTISEGTVEEELARFEAAVETVVAKLSKTAEKMREAAIFDAHIELSGS